VHLDDEYLKEDKDGPRTSSASRRTCGSARSSAFFVNASRSPRDLTTLAARVHSPIFDQQNYAASIPGMVDHDENRDLGMNEKRSDDGRLSEWTLPSLSFRPFSMSSYHTRLENRPKTSGDVPAGESIEILSPMPGRPMSSQSRKRFSRILEIEDDNSSIEAKMTHQSLPGQTFRRLTVVEEQLDRQLVEGDIPDTGIEPASGQRSSKENYYRDFEAVANPSSIAAHETSKITIHDKSTVESLLDRHIECLGLHEDDRHFEFDDISGHSHSNMATHTYTAESTIKLSSAEQPVLSQARLRPTTSSSYQHTSLASSERRRLMPRRLFASMDARLPTGALIGNLSSSVSQISSTASRNHLRSSGWQTLPSTAESTPGEVARNASLNSGDLGDVDSDPPLKRFKVKQRSELILSPSMPSELSRVSEVDSELGYKDASHRRSKSDILARQASHQRRRMRILLKTQRKVATAHHPSPAETPHVSEDITEEAGLDESWTTEESHGEAFITSPVLGYVELSADTVTAMPPTDTTMPSVLLSSSVPRRWASVIAAMPEPVKKGIDLVRKASARTVGSHRSNTSIIEPINSTRQSSLLPQIASVPQLAPPEFGPPLTFSDLNISLRFPRTLAPTRPPLREAQSFFSDDSSAQRQRIATRKRFDLPSLRSGVTRSSGMLGLRPQHSLAQTGEGLRPSHSWQIKGQKSFEYPQSSGGDTIAMSDFQYRKRKMFERLKDWWKRQCMQRTLALVKKKHGKNSRHDNYI